MVTKVSTTFILHNQNVRKLKRIFAIALVLFPMLGMAQELKLDTQNATVSFDFVSEGTSGTVGGIDATLSLNWSDLANSSVRGTADVVAASNFGIGCLLIIPGVWLTSLKSFSER